MAEVATFKLEGMDELIKQCEKVAAEMPDEMKKATRKVVNKFRREVRKKTPVRTGRTGKSYKIRYEGFGLDMEAVFYAERKKKKAFYFSPLEGGHKVVPRKSKKADKRKESSGGKTYVEGRHMVRDTAEDFQTIYPRELEKALEKVLQNVK